MLDSQLLWKRLRAFPAEDYRIFKVASHEAAHPTTEVVRRVNVITSPDWVNVIALTPDDQVVMVRQHRAGTDTITLEIPGGMIDPGEGPLDGGRRELLEETGYVADTWIHIGSVEPNPAIQDNTCHTLLALDARLEGPQ